MAKKSRASKAAAARRAPRKAAKAARKAAKARKARTTRRAKATRTARPAKSKAKTTKAKAKAKAKPRVKSRARAKAQSARKSPRRSSAAPTAAAGTRRPTTARPAAIAKKPNLDRERRTIRDEEQLLPSTPSSLNLDRAASAARSGRHEFEQKLREHTSTGPALTGGDLDADWEDAEAVGEEAPGGDNPTPDQDIVDEIGKAMGIEYDDDEELQGGDELAARDRHRWELDPASKEDFEDE